MFGPLIAWAGRLALAWWGVIKPVLNSGVVKSALYAGFVLWLATRVKDQLTSAILKFADVILPSGTMAPNGALSTMLNLANTFFPLNEAMVFLAAHFALLVALTSYKTVKTYLPLH